MREIVIFSVLCALLGGFYQWKLSSEREQISQQAISDLKSEEMQEAIALVNSRISEKSSDEDSEPVESKESEIQNSNLLGVENYEPDPNEVAQPLRLDDLEQDLLTGTEYSPISNEAQAKLETQSLLTTIDLMEMPTGDRSEFLNKNRNVLENYMTESEFGEENTNETKN